MQQRFIGTLCDAGDDVEYRVYPGVGHITIAHDSADDVVQWIADRFAGVPATSNCG